MKPHLLSQTLCAGTLAFSFFLAGCEPGWDSSDGGSATPTPENPGDLDPTFVGPGSSWRLEMDDEELDFTLTKHDKPDGELLIDVSGSYETLNSGFTRFSISSISTGSTVDANKTFAAIIAGDAVVVAEAIERNDNNQKIMVNADTCPTQSQKSNWVLFKQSADFNSSEETPYHYGTLDYSTVTNGATFKTYSLDENVDGTGEAGEVTGKCTDGLATGNEVPTRYYLTLAPNSISERGATEEEFEAGNTENAQFTLSVTPRTITAITDFDGDFIGFYSNTEFSGDRRQFPVKVNCASGTCTMNEMTDLDDGTLSSDAYSLTFTTEALNDPETGMILGKLVAPGETAENQIMCSINTDYDANDDDGQVFFACVGKVPGSSNYVNFINLFLITQ